MFKVLSPDQFVKLIKGKDKKQEIVRYATVDPSYSGTGRPSLIFDGETSPTVKQYPCIGTITANDRVMVLKGTAIGPIK